MLIGRNNALKVEESSPTGSLLAGAHPARRDKRNSTPLVWSALSTPRAGEVHLGPAPGQAVVVGGQIELPAPFGDLLHGN